MTTFDRDSSLSSVSLANLIDIETHIQSYLGAHTTGEKRKANRKARLHNLIINCWAVIMSATGKHEVICLLIMDSILNGVWHVDKRQSQIYLT